MSHIDPFGRPVDRPLKLRFPKFASLIEGKYDLIKNIGEGLYWEQVFTGNDCLDNSTVLLRFVKFGKGVVPNQLLFNNEMSVLEELTHENIAGISETIVSNDLVCFVSEYKSQNLSTLIGSTTKVAQLDQDRTKRFMYQILQALSFCHFNEVIHFDLTPQNLYVDAESDTIKLANFSLGKIVDLVNPGTVTLENKPTFVYTAPEMVLCDPPFSFGVDIWALGCIFAEMTTKHVLFDRHVPFDKRDAPSALMFAIIKLFGVPEEQDWPENTSFADCLELWGINVVPDFGPTLGLGMCVPGLDVQGLDLLSRMLSFNPENRISANDALQHPYFNDLNL